MQKLLLAPYKEHASDTFHIIIITIKVRKRQIRMQNIHKKGKSKFYFILTQCFVLIIACHLLKYTKSFFQAFKTICNLYFYYYCQMHVFTIIPFSDLELHLCLIFQSWEYLIFAANVTFNLKMAKMLFWLFRLLQVCERLFVLLLSKALYPVNYTGV